MGGNRKFQLRWEIYNLFNHPQWNAVDTTAQFNAAGEQIDPAFGTVTTVRTERRMQVSVRFLF
jgi:hypothetical protein